MPYTAITSLRRKADRDRFITDLSLALSPLVSMIVVRNSLGQGSRTVSCYGEGLSALLWVEPGSNVPLVHWHDAKRRLKGVPGAWTGDNINRFHGHKATSFPESLDDLIACLVRGLVAAKDGSAFLDDP